MMTIRKIRNQMLIALMLLAATTSFAQRRYYSHMRHYGYCRPVVTTIVTRRCGTSCSPVQRKAVLRAFTSTAKSLF